MGINNSQQAAPTNCSHSTAYKHLDKIEVLGDAESIQIGERNHQKVYIYTQKN